MLDIFDVNQLFIKQFIDQLIHVCYTSEGIFYLNLNLPKIIVSCVFSNSINVTCSKTTTPKSYNKVRETVHVLFICTITIHMIVANASNKCFLLQCHNRFKRRYHFEKQY